ncbi:MAG: methyltransferase domain-containing protein [Deltaproteobacteria bacterium]|nr:methyltransferase domain-containing protein [Deltaproteobacteria bacterium]
MAALTASGPNAEQITYWNEVTAPTWLAFQEMIDRQIGPLGRAAMERAAVRSGERVIDVGCGCGDTTLELGRRVGPGGSVLGIDLSAPMLERAAERAAREGMSAVRFCNADVQTHEFSSADFDLAYSRFGVMFFSDPVRAFGSLRRALRPGGRLSFVCWQEMARNPWVAVPLAAAATVIPLPPRPSPDAPGPFSFADPERVRRILDGAGFAAIALEPHEQPLAIADGDLDRAVELALALGPTSAALREAGAAAAPRVAAAVREALARSCGEHGVRLGSAVWLVGARRP